MELLTKLNKPEWYAEKYNRETNQGDKPACKSCYSKINIGTLCLRIDYSYVMFNRNRRPDDWTLSTAAFKICKKREGMCHFL